MVTPWGSKTTELVGGGGGSKMGVNVIWLFKSTIVQSITEYNVYTNEDENV